MFCCYVFRTHRPSLSFPNIAYFLMLTVSSEILFSHDSILLANFLFEERKHVDDFHSVLFKFVSNFLSLVATCN